MAWRAPLLAILAACGCQPRGSEAQAEGLPVSPSNVTGKTPGPAAPPGDPVAARLAALTPTTGIPDPARDEVLFTVAGSVHPDDAQWARFVALYQAFRADQSALVDRYSVGLPGRGRTGGPPGGAAPAGSPPRGRPGGGPPPGGPSGGGGPGAGGGPGRMQQQIAAARTELLALQDQFLSEGRTIWTTDAQRAAWDTCAASVNLFPPSTKGALDEAFLDPDAGPKVGELAPDFHLRDVAGSLVQLSSFRGKPLVIEFGSYTCPAFRAQSRRLQPLIDGYGGRVGFVVVYGHEAHPTDAWVSAENVREGIAIASHTTWEERQTCALLTRDALGLKATILVDELAETVVRGWGGHPNAGYVLDAAGVVVSRQHFIDAAETGRVLDGLLAGTGGR